MIKIAKYIVFGIVFLGLAGCGISGEFPLSSHPTGVVHTPAVVSTVLPASPIHLPTTGPTLIAPTQAQETPTITNTISVVNNQVRRACPTFISHLSQENRLSGNLILESGARHVFINMETGQVNPTIREQLGGRYKVSPDRTKYAYLEGDPLQIVVKSLDGTVIKSFRMEQDWINLSKWANDDTLLILLRNGEYPNLIYPLPLMAININSGDRRTLLPYDYPGISNTQNALNWDSVGTTMYDSSLTQVVYVGFNKQAGIVGYIVWDRVNKRKIAEIQNDHFSDMPVWAPDGSMVFLPDQEKGFLLVGRNGERSKIVDFDKITLTDEGGRRGKILYPLLYNWSPDNRHIALWVRTDAEDFDALLVLDTLTGDVLDLCISQNDDIAHYNDGDYDQMIWSPDGKAIVINANINTLDQTWDVVMVNLEQSIAYKVVSGGKQSPVGWLLKKE